MYKLLFIIISVFALSIYAAPGLGHTGVHQPEILHHHGGHAVHSHVIHHPAPVKAVVAKPVIVKPVVPVLPVHHAHPAVIAHH